MGFANDPVNDTDAFASSGSTGGGSSTPATVSASTASPIAAGAVAASVLHGWSLRNTAAVLTQVRLHFGTDASGTDFIPINLAENETVTEMLHTSITITDGLFVEIVAGTLDGILYSSPVA